MSRTVTWTRTERRPDIPLAMQDEKPLVTIADLGIERVCAEPMYDNGTFIVIDSVKDIVFMVCRITNGIIQPYREVRFDKYEAIRVADELLESENRNGALA